MEENRKSLISRENPSIDGENLLSDANSKSSDDESSEDFSKESSVKFSDHDFHEFLLTESHRKGLEKKSVELNAEIESESEKNNKLNQQLFDFLTEQGVSCDPDDVEDPVVVEQYQSMLENLFGVNEEYQKLSQLMQQRSAEAMAEKQEKLDTFGRLQLEFTEMVTAAMSDPRHKPCPPEKVIDKLVKRFEKAYENTLLVRLEYLKAQNALVELVEKEESLSNIGDGWKTLDYDNLTTEVQTVSSTIDLKQEQMEKLWNRYHKEVKALKSMKSELDELQRSIELENENYESLRAQEVDMLTALQNLDEEKKDLKEKFTDLSHRAGILSRKPLMKHYDSVDRDISRFSRELTELEALDTQLVGEAISLKIKIRENVSKSTLESETDQLSPQTSELADCMQICKIDI